MSTFVAVPAGAGLRRPDSGARRQVDLPPGPPAGGPGRRPIPPLGPVHRRGRRAHRRRHPGLWRRGDNRIRWQRRRRRRIRPPQRAGRPGRRRELGDRYPSPGRVGHGDRWPHGAVRRCLDRPPTHGTRRRPAAVHGRKDRWASRRTTATARGPRRRIERNRLPPPGAECPGQRSRSPRRAGRRGADDGARGRADPAAHRGALGAVRRRHRDRRRLGDRPRLAASGPSIWRSRRPVPGRLLDRGRVRHPGERTDGGSRVRRPRPKWFPGRAATHGRRHRGRRRPTPSPTRPASSPDTVHCTPPTSAARKCRR